jgi:carboxyl-terminal processing protease
MARVRTDGVTIKVYIASMVVVAVVAFVVGTRGESLVASIAPMVGIKIPATSGTLDLKSVQETYQQLAHNYDGTLDTQKLIDGASRGVAAAAGDQWTVFMDKAEAADFDKELTGKIGGGIGAEIGTRSGQPTIIRVLPDNPAEKAGLQAGDVIVEVSGKSTVGLASDKTVSLIRGEVGTTVKIIVRRADESKEFTITRATIVNPSVQSSVVDGIGTLRITRFDGETGSLAEAAARDFKQKGVSKVILDLRDTGGGYVTAAQDVAGLWLDNKVVVTEKTGSTVVDELRSGSRPILAGIKTVVLVNGNSASASEIVAGALQDYGAATLIGEKTYGKGTVQKLVDLENGAKLKVTTARWYTPKGKNITKEGIQPDQKVTLSLDDVNAGRDPQVDAARASLIR